MAGKKKKTGNKTKSSLKIKNKKVVASVPTEWYYMSPEEVTVESIRRILDEEQYDIHIWKEMGILEVGFRGDEKGSLDIEKCALDLGDDASNEFLEERGIKSLFYLSFKAEDEKDSMEVVNKIVREMKGICCGDTEDFTPEIS